MNYSITLSSLFSFQSLIMCHISQVWLQIFREMSVMYQILRCCFGFVSCSLYPQRSRFNLTIEPHLHYAWRSNTHWNKLFRDIYVITCVIHCSCNPIMTSFGLLCRNTTQHRYIWWKIPYLSNSDSFEDAFIREVYSMLRWLHINHAKTAVYLKKFM